MSAAVYVPMPSVCRIGSDQPDAGEAATSPCTLLLIRHAHTAAVGLRIAGRQPGVPLSAEGAAEAERLGRAVAICHRLTAIYTSPLARARDTALALARHQHTDLHEDSGLTEIDFGEWTGKTFVELAGDPAWRAFNTARANAIVPGGERPAAAQRRIVATVARLSHRHPGAAIALVTHADLIRFALLHYLSLSLNLYDRFEINPASVTRMAIDATGCQVLEVNNLVFASTSG
jgi:broad specificity phosphatase PhoE